MTKLANGLRVRAMRWVVAGLATMLLFAACGGDDADSGGDGVTTVEGSTWQLATLADGVDVIPGSGASVGFAEGTAAGATGCNSFTGPYTLDGDAISIGPLATTLAACLDPAFTAQENSFLAALNSAASQAIETDVLTLSDADGAALATLDRFEQSVVGAWDVVSYNNGNEAVVSVIIGTQITAEFDADGVVSGSGGCNEYSGTYQSSDSGISIGRLSATERSCPDPAETDAQEQLFLTALESAATWSIQGTLLTMRDADGATVVVLAPRG